MMMQENEATKSELETLKLNQKVQCSTSLLCSCVVMLHQVLVLTTDSDIPTVPSKATSEWTHSSREDGPHEHREPAFIGDE